MAQADAVGTQAIKTMGDLLEELKKLYPDQIWMGMIESIFRTRTPQGAWERFYKLPIEDSLVYDFATALRKQVWDDLEMGPEEKYINNLELGHEMLRSIQHLCAEWGLVLDIGEIDQPLSLLDTAVASGVVEIVEADRAVDAGQDGA